MTKYHVSDDGIARVCRAKTENACRVKGALKGEHFNTSEEAQEAYETTQNPQSKSLKKKSTNTSTKERKKLKPKDLDQDLSKEETNQAAVTSRKVASLHKKELNSSLNYVRTLSDLSTVFNKAGFNAIYSSGEQHKQSLDVIRKKMYNSNIYSPHELKEIDDQINTEKYKLDLATLKAFQKEKDTEKIRFWDNKETRREKESYNKYLNNRENELIQKLADQKSKTNIE